MVVYIYINNSVVVSMDISTINQLGHFLWLQMTEYTSLMEPLG